MKKDMNNVIQTYVQNRVNGLPGEVGHPAHSHAEVDHHLGPGPATGRCSLRLWGVEKNVKEAQRRIWSVESSLSVLWMASGQSGQIVVVAPIARDVEEGSTPKKEYAKGKLVLEDYAPQEKDMNLRTRKSFWTVIWSHALLTVSSLNGTSQAVLQAVTAQAQ